MSLAGPAPHGAHLTGLQTVPQLWLQVESDQCRKVAGDALESSRPESYLRRLGSGTGCMQAHSAPRPQAQRLLSPQQLVLDKQRRCF
jgi:hypothetical protein